MTYLIVVFCQVASAESTQEVTITATGANGTACTAPTDLQVGVVDSYNILVTWTPDPGASTTIVRMDCPTCPEDSTDGYAVYNGTGSMVMYETDFEINVSQPICVRAWSNCGNGTVSTGYDEAQSRGGTSMIFFALIVFGATMSYVSIRSSFGLLKLGASVAWISLLSYVLVYPPSPIVDGSSVQIILVLAFAALAVAVPLMGLGQEIYRQSGPGEPGTVTRGFSWRRWRMSEDDDYVEPRVLRIDRQDKYREKIRRVLGRDR